MYTGRSRKSTFLSEQTAVPQLLRDRECRAEQVPQILRNRGSSHENGPTESGGPHHIDIDRAGELDTWRFRHARHGGWQRSTVIATEAADWGLAGCGSSRTGRRSYVWAD
jgi:hypothetical protein